MKNIASFLGRQKLVNHGEILFENYCLKVNYKFWRLGNEEKHNEIDHYWKLNPMIRNLPDYIVDTGKHTFVVAVKGTANFKEKEVNMLPLFMEWYSSKDAPFTYAFCFKDQPPKLIYPEKIIELYKVEKDKKWNDGVVYRTLKI